MKTIVPVSSIIAGLLLSNCASIVSKSTYPVTVNSQPQGMVFVVTDLATDTVVAQGKTPQEVSLNAKAGYMKSANYRIDVKKGNRVVATNELNAGIDGWYFGNILIGGLIGMLIVDPLTGAMFKLPDSVTVGGEKALATLDLDGASLKLVSIDALTPAQRKGLVRI